MDIYVGNLPYKVNDQDLQQLFEQFGSVSSARVIIDKFTGDSKGFGFVQMDDNGEANAAIDSLNDQDFQGRNLRVNESQPRPPRSGGGGGGGYGGGGRGRGGDRDRRGGGGGGGGGRW